MNANQGTPRKAVSLLARLLWLSVLAVASAQGVVWPVHAQTGSEPSAALSPDEEQVAQSINRIRQDAGLALLTVHPLLNQSARNHIQDMVTSGHYGHSGSDGSYAAQRIRRTGYQVDGWSGEIWAAYQDVATAIRWWMSDAPHRDSILNASYKEMGIGTHPHPNGRSLIVVVNFTTGGADQAAGYAVAPGEAAIASHQPQNVSVAVSENGRHHRVQPGDTLFGISLRYGLEWRTLAAANGLTEYSLLQLGDALVLPESASLAATSTGGAALSQAAGNTRQHVVQPGDTLFGISLRYGLEWRTLAAANGLAEHSLLQLGDALVLPESTSSAAMSTGGAALSQAAGNTRQHVVQSGDTLYTIAARFDVDWEDLAAHNGLASNALLQIDQVLQIPGSGSDQTEMAAGTLRYHTVAEGDTIVGIATRYSVDWQDLLRLNNLTETNLLHLGQKIQLPAGVEQP